MERDNLTPEELFQERTFDAKAASYDNQTASLGERDNRNHAIKATRISDLLAPEPGESLLEVGVGSGLHADWLLRRHPETHYTGIDISSKLAALTAERLSGHGDRVRVLHDNANEMSFDDASFDGVFCAATLHHMQDPGHTVREMSRVLRPGGRLVMMEPNWLYPTNWLFMAFLKEDRHMFLMRRGYLLEWMAAAGLEQCRVENLLYTPPKPESLIPVFEHVDRIAAMIPAIRRASLMLASLGIKPAA